MAAEEIVREFEMLAGMRGTWESHWQEIAERVLPRGNNFTDVRRERGEKKMEKVYDSTAILALDRFASAMDSLLTPRIQRWHTLRATNTELMQDRDVNLWFDEVTRILFAYRYSPKANFSSQNHERYIQLGAFGTGSMFVDENAAGGIRYKACHLAEIYFTVDHQGVVNGVYRKFPMTVAQAVGRWGRAVPEKIANHKNPHQEFEFLHVVRERNDFDPNRADAKGKRYASYYIALDTKTLLSEGGYSTFPYSISRYVTAPGEVYGRSPAMQVLPDIKMLNEMSKTDIRAVHKLVDPPLLLHDDGVLGGGGMAVSLTPGALNFGGVNADGRQLIQPLQTGARVDIAEEKMEQRRRTINDAFMVTLFQILVENPQMTATEAMIRAQEKGQLIGPAMGRQQSEAFGPMIERELDILQRQGVLPPMPGALLEAEGEYEIEYDSPFSRMQRSEEVVGISRTLEIAAPFAQIDPSVMEVFDGPEVVRLAAQINGVPYKVLRSKEDVQKRIEAQNQAAQDQADAERVPMAAGAMRDVAQAQALLREPV